MSTNSTIKFVLIMAGSNFFRFFHFSHILSMHISIHVLLVLYSTKCVSTVHKICIHFEFIKRKCTFRAPCGVFSFVKRKSSCFFEHTTQCIYTFRIGEATFSHLCPGFYIEICNINLFLPSDKLLIFMKCSDGTRQFTEKFNKSSF